MKNNKPILIITLVLAMLAITLVILQKTGSIKRELRDFAVKDTAHVTKIFMADKIGRKVILERVSANKWMVNGKYAARKDAIDLLLESIAVVDVISPVAKAAYNNTIKDLASGSVKVEVYLKGDLEKTYYVGHETQEQTGTYMLLEHSTMPFIMGIPGFQGYLTPRYFVFEQEWRDRKVFSYDNPNDIAKIEVSYRDNPDKSFIIENNNKNFVLKPISPAYKDISFAQEKVKSYITNYMNVALEAFINNQTVVKDSVRKVTPFATMSVTSSNGQKQVLKLVYIPNSNPEMKDANGRMIQYNPERLYGLWNNDQDLVLMQFTTMDRLLKWPEDFVKSLEQHNKK